MPVNVNSENKQNLLLGIKRNFKNLGNGCLYLSLFVYPLCMVLIHHLKPLSIN